MRRWLIAGLVVLTLAGMRPAASAADSQPDCDASQLLTAGQWSGSFEAERRDRWNAELGNLPTSSTPAPATWTRTHTLRGDIDLVVREEQMGDAPAITGIARATGRIETVAEREDGARMTRTENGWLSGGSIVVRAGRDLGAGDEIEWLGAWWTRPAGAGAANFSLTFTNRSSDGRTLYGDGHLVAQPAEAPRFDVTAVSCREITGTVALGGPVLGSDVAPETVSTSGTFTLRWLVPQPR